MRKEYRKNVSTEKRKRSKWQIVLVGTLCLGFLLPGEGSTYRVQAVNNGKKTCSTVEECDQLLGTINSQVGSLNEEQAVKESEKKDLETQRYEVQQHIAQIQTKIEEVKVEILETERDIEAAEIRKLKLEDEIRELRERVNRIIVLNDRLQRKNPIFTWLSESESFSKLIQTSRNHQKVSNQIKELVDELSAKVQELNQLLEKLEQDKARLVEKRQELETQETELVNKRNELIHLEQQIQKEIQRLQELKMEANEIKQIIEKQKNAIIEASNESFRIPLETGYVTCEFACYVDRNGVPHNGIDLGNYGNTSTKVLASASGTVTRSGWHPAYGNHVIITHNLNGKIFTTLYAHMHTTPYVSVGQTVRKGQVIGTMGTTGNSTGPHLHFELYEGYYNWPHSVNPRKYINFPSRW